MQPGWEKAPDNEGTSTNSCSYPVGLIQVRGTRSLSQPNLRVKLPNLTSRRTAPRSGRGAAGAKLPVIAKEPGRSVAKLENSVPGAKLPMIANEPGRALRS